MSGGGFGGKQTTTSTPSPFDVQKAATLSELNQLLIPYLMPDLSGQITAGKQKQISGANKNAMSAAAKMGVAKGSPQFAGAMQAPIGNSDMLNYALALYGVPPSGKASTSTTSTPGVFDMLGSAGNLALMIKLMGGGGGRTQGLPSGVDTTGGGATTESGMDYGPTGFVNLP